MTIEKYSPEHREQVISVWEKSVLASHQFLSAAEIDYYKSIVETIDFSDFQVYCLTGNDTVAGFIGLSEQKIEMLFLAPEHTRKGLGKKLMNFAIRELNANEVDVNEENKSACQFYLKSGFTVFGREEKDSEGKDHPILKMRLQTT
ncbi:MAG: GNAT family N-acetyltransferase [Chitinophagaceae bacterium]|jgi:putative acetyltransferase